jgi:secreted trypsin-like serine protease
LNAVVGWDGCGASLIHEDIILSAAHCSPVVSNTVLIGAYRRNSEQQDAEFRSIGERRPHPDYNGATVENDFLVMKLDQAVSSTLTASVSANSETNIISNVASLVDKTTDFYQP